MRITVAIAVAAVSWRSARETRKTRAAATARARDIAFMRLTDGVRGRDGAVVGGLGVGGLVAGGLAGCPLVGRIGEVARRLGEQLPAGGRPAIAGRCDA
jgi:hypothetical protein